MSPAASDLTLAVDMVPPRGLLTSRALKVTKRNVYPEMGVFFIDLHHILCARSCLHFLWFPHTPKPSSLLKRPKNFNLLFVFFQLYLFGLLLGPILAMVTRPVQGP